MPDPPESPFPNPQGLVLLALIVEGGLGVLAVGLGWWWDCPPAERIDFTWTALGYGTLASLPMLALFLLCLRLPIRPLVNLRRVVDQLLVPLFQGCRTWTLLFISVLAGVGEEMLFRGVIQEGIAVRIGGPWGTWVGLTTAATLFGLLHLITPTYAVLASLIGLYLGWLQLETNNLLVPIVTHAAYDFFALWYLVKYRPANQPRVEE